MSEERALGPPPEGLYTPETFAAGMPSTLLSRRAKQTASVGRLWFQGKLPNLTSRDAMRALLDTFPSLADFPGEWDAMAFQSWAQSLSHGGIESARFVLSVWNPNTRWRLGKFSLHNSMSVWDLEHRAAFIAWAREPWWP